MTKQTFFEAGAVVRLYKKSGSGKWTQYKRTISDDTAALLIDGERRGFVASGNDAARGGRLGCYYKILKSFTAADLEKLRQDEQKELKKQLAEVLPSQTLRDFHTVSDKGAFKIDKKLYKNFYGDGLNRVKIKLVNFEAFKRARLVSRRQVFRPGEPFFMRKFRAPRDIKLFNYDCGRVFVHIVSACGFCIWERSLTVFVNQED